MEEKNDISKKVVVILIITLVTVTIISWVTLTSYANSLNARTVTVSKYTQNKRSGTVGINIVNKEPLQSVSNSGKVGVTVVKSK